jgi:hypothetical protein
VSLKAADTEIKKARISARVALLSAALGAAATVLAAVIANVSGLYQIGRVQVPAVETKKAVVSDTQMVVNEFKLPTTNDKCREAAVFALSRLGFRVSDSGPVFGSKEGISVAVLCDPQPHSIIFAGPELARLRELVDIANAEISRASAHSKEGMRKQKQYLGETGA